jgi:hypothetical protein
VGASQKLSLQIDTGSSDLILSKGVYQPSGSAVETGGEFSIEYKTKNEDGSGADTVGIIYYT